MSDREGLDLFLGDMAGHQGRHAREVTPVANQRLAVPLFEHLDQKQADQERKTWPATISATPPEVRASDVEAKRRGLRIDRTPDNPALIARWSPAEEVRANATRKRLELLLTKVERGPLGQPSWAERLRAILAVQVHDPRKRTGVAHQVNDLIAESEIVFGSIFIERPRRIQVGG